MTYADALNKLIALGLSLDAAGRFMGRAEARYVRSSGRQSIFDNNGIFLKIKTLYVDYDVYCRFPINEM